MTDTTTATDGTEWGNEAPVYLSARQTAIQIGVDVRTVLRWLQNGEHGFDVAHKLPGVTGKWRVPRTAVATFIRTHSAKGDTDGQPTQEDHGSGGQGPGHGGDGG